MRGSSISFNLLTGQQPVALEDKHKPWLRALQAQPEKSVTKAESAAGAESQNYIIRFEIDTKICRVVIIIQQLNKLSMDV